MQRERVKSLKGDFSHHNLVVLTVFKVLFEKNSPKFFVLEMQCYIKRVKDLC